MYDFSGSLIKCILCSEIKNLFQNIILESYSKHSAKLS